tara:strand:+ start:751 stop:921 length:171 start_codon:yes stop_codon:yes gene_type:complete
MIQRIGEIFQIGPGFAARVRDYAGDARYIHLSRILLVARIGNKSMACQSPVISSRN